MSMTGHPDGPPARLGIGVIDLGTAMWAAVGIQAALGNRSEYGMGALVEVSLYETAAWWLSYHMEGYLATGDSPQRQGTGLRSSLRTRCSQPVKAISWSRPETTVCSSPCAGCSICLDYPRIRPTRTTLTESNRIALCEVLEVRFKERTAAEWEVLLGSESVPCSRVRTVADLAHDPQLDALEMLIEMPHPDIPDLRVVDIPLTLDGGVRHTEGHRHASVNKPL